MFNFAFWFSFCTGFSASQPVKLSLIYCQTQPARHGKTSQNAPLIDITSACNGDTSECLCGTDGRQQPPLNRIEHCILKPDENNPDTADNYGDVTRRRYPLPDCSRPCFSKQLILLRKIKLVPVVGLEPTRLFMVPGF